jgi:AcrR family transcriptional regulator
MLDAAVELFALQGYIKTTLNQVGQTAGYTGGLVSSRFGSKEDLLKAVLQRISHRFLNVQVAKVMDPKDTRGSLHRFVDTYLTEVSKKKSATRALYVVMGEALGAIIEVQREIAEFNALTRENLAGIIRNGIERKEVPARVDADAAAYLILGIIRGITMQYLSDPRAFKVSDLIQEVTDMIDDYLWAPR